MERIRLPYNLVRDRIGDADLLLFPGRSLWPSIPIRWWTNGYPWWHYKGWLSLGPWSHAEVAAWDSDTLLAWGSVGGGPRKIPLSRLLYQYGSFCWAPFTGDPLERVGMLAKAEKLWRPGPVDYPSVRQYIRTAFRGWFSEKVDCDPNGYTCWEWVATVHGLNNPAAKWAADLAECGRFGQVVEVLPDPVEEVAE